MMIFDARCETCQGIICREGDDDARCLCCGRPVVHLEPLPLADERCFQ